MLYLFINDFILELFSTKTMANFDLYNDSKSYYLMHIFSARITLVKNFNANEAIEKQ